MPGPRILLLGGTGLARELAQGLSARKADFVSSLAGLTQQRAEVPGPLRLGGFGGAEGLASYLAREKIGCIVDATHPFALQMSQNAHAGAQRAGIAYMRLEAKAWQAGRGERWRPAASLAQAALMPAPNARLLLTIGSRQLEPFAARRDLGGVARMIEKPAVALSESWQLLFARPPFSAEQERQLMKQATIDMLVSKNSGNEMVQAKLVAARDLGLEVIMIERPEKPAAETCHTAQEALAHLQALGVL